MHDFPISTTVDGSTPLALTYGRWLAETLPAGTDGDPLLLSGSGAPMAAACAWALAEQRQLILPPAGLPSEVGGVHLDVAPDGLHATARDTAVGSARWSWTVAFSTSGSTGSPRSYGFTRTQLDQLATWYASIYDVTERSVIVTALPVAYNFAFVAGLCLAASLGARLHLSPSQHHVFDDARRLAAQHDRCVILANPVLLQNPPRWALPDNVLIDSGGAPLSITAISRYREDVADLREGYGLTETGSLTHFDADGNVDSLGTVGKPLPGAGATIDPDTQRIVVTSPAIGVPLTDPSSPAPSVYRTTDMGRIDAAGRLRLLGRSDDHPVASLWPRDILDILGPILGTRCAAVHHPAPDRVRVRLAETPDDRLSHRLKVAVCTATDIPASNVELDSPDGPLLTSVKLPRPTTSRQEAGR